MNMPHLGRLLIVLGIALIVVGIVFIVAPRLPFPGRLPGDIVIRKEKFTFYFPIATSIIISLLISLILWIFRSK